MQECVEPGGQIAERRACGVALAQWARTARYCSLSFRWPLHGHPELAALCFPVQQWCVGRVGPGSAHRICWSQQRRSSLHISNVVDVADLWVCAHSCCVWCLHVQQVAYKQARMRAFAQPLLVVAAALAVAVSQAAAQQCATNPPGRQPANSQGWLRGDGSPCTSTGNPIGVRQSCTVRCNTGARMRGSGHSCCQVVHACMCCALPPAQFWAGPSQLGTRTRV